MLTILPLKLIISNFSHLQNASYPRVLTDSGKSTFTKLLQQLNALSPIEVNVDGNVIVFSFVQSEKHPVGIAVNFSGSTISSKDVQSVNVCQENVVFGFKNVTEYKL